MTPSLLVLLSLLPAQEGVEFFEKRIRPVLAERCYACHSSKLREPKADLRLDGPTPGLHAKILKAISYTDLHLRMPPTGKLPDAAIANFEAWVKMGAPDPRPALGAAPKPLAAALDLNKARRFWAFQPLLSATPPAVKNQAWPQGAVDRFLLAKLEAKNLTPAPEADRRAWLRRATFDLTGLPPAVADLERFAVGRESHEQAVDRLLASPHYGERQARHWFDLVRFAETNGHEYDNSKLDAWQYRDYVIRAFNEDLPYARFVEEHLAGDLLPDPRLSKDGRLLESPLGTGFFWFGEVLNSATDSVKSRADQVDNQIDVASKTFLGLTMACARCHDHKFDPIPTRDYYGLAGVFHGASMREAVIDSPRVAQAIHAAHAQVAPVRRHPGRAKIALRPGETIWEDFDDLTKNGWHVTGEAFTLGARQGIVDSAGRGAHELVGALASKKFRMPNHYVHMRLNATKGNKALQEREPVRVTLVADDFKSIHFMGSGSNDFEWVTFRMTLPYQRLCYFEIVDRSRTGAVAVDAIVFSEEKDPPPTTIEEPAAWMAPTAVAGIPDSNWGMIAWDEAPGDIRLHIRGSHQNLGEEVPRHFPVVLSRQPAAITGSGRLEFARWLTSDAQALTARVYVNRIWKQHFGEGLARTTDNFGLTGEPPTHRELLDTLAARFIANGWSTKQLHRELMLSAAYRMKSSGQNPEADPRNDLLSHYPVRRLEAEAIRDAMLTVAGALDPRLYGPSVTPHISAYQDGRGKPKSGPLDGGGRRSLYIEVRRNFLTPFFLAFDYPLPISTIGNRNRSTVPSQALMLMNNDFVLAQAGRWASRVAAEPDRLAVMYQQAFARAPQPWERKEAEAFLSGGGSLADLAHVLFNSPEFIYVQ